MKKTENYCIIDLLKLIMSFAVIAIHTEPMHNINNKNITEIFMILLEYAVPFFFLSSGYLIGKRMEYPLKSPKNIEIIKKQIKKIIKMYIIWTLIYSPLTIHQYIIDGTPFFGAFSLYIKRIILVGEQHNAWHLWYLLSTIYALIIILFFTKRNASTKKILFVSFCFSIISIVFTQLVEYPYELPYMLNIIKKLIRSIFRDGRVFLGIVYLPIGFYLSKKTFPKILNWISLILGITLTYLIDNQTIDFYLLIITSISFFEIIKNINLKEHKFYRFARESSTIIFLIHMYIWFIYYMVVYGKRTVGLDHFIFTSIVSLIISIIYISVKNNISKNKVK